MPSTAQGLSQYRCYKSFLSSCAPGPDLPGCEQSCPASRSGRVPHLVPYLAIQLILTKSRRTFSMCHAWAVRTHSCVGSDLGHRHRLGVNALLISLSTCNMSFSLLSVLDGPRKNQPRKYNSFDVKQPQDKIPDRSPNIWVGCSKNNNR